MSGVSLIFVVVVSLLQLSVAEPERRTSFQKHVHRRASVPKRDRRDMITVTDASLTSTTELPEIVFYVDQLGNPVSTATEIVVYVPPTTSSTTSSPIETSSLLPAATAGSASSLNGITYSPYKGTGDCKSASEVDADFAIFGFDYGIVRIYGVDCDQVASVYAAAKKYDNKLFLGIFEIDTVASAVAIMAAGVQNDWGIVDTVSVGNELVNNGAKSSDQVIAAIAEARSALRSAGYQGPVVTVDTFVAAIAHPELCNESDYCAVNVHPFFDVNTGAAEAGSFIAAQLLRIRTELSDSNKRIVVTETGWPWKGDTNGAAIPGMDYQTAAISSIKNSFASNPADCILFTAFNDLWKQAAASTFFAEQYWGMGGRSSASDN